AFASCRWVSTTSLVRAACRRCRRGAPSPASCESGERSVRKSGGSVLPASARHANFAATMTAPLLIVNADDFGLTPGLSRAILDGGARGIVSSTSAVANGKALLDTAPTLRDSGLGVGAHLALVGHQGPVLGAREIPTLVDKNGNLSTG